MKITVKYCCLFCVVSVWVIAAGVENPNVGNPLISSGTPATASQSQRLITQPGVNTYGRSGNDIVSGNVGGFKYFRGVVPYGSSYYSGAYSGDSDSASVSDFLRRSADPLVDDRNPGQSRTYYEPRRTVSSLIRPDSDSGLSKPQLIGQGRENPYKLSAPTQQLKVDPITRPISINDMELEKILARQEKLREEAIQKAETTDMTEPVKKSFFDTALLTEPIVEPQLPDQPVTDETQTEQQPTEAETDTQAKLSPAEQVAADALKEIQDAMTEQESIRTPEEQADSQTQADTMSPKGELPANVKSESALIDEGHKVLGKHETFASLADEKFNTYMLLAETHLKKGQFYKAADIYALANVWKPDDTRAYMGRSFSLFFAGEYMSSGYYLSRAIELNPNLALAKYNLTDLAGSRDVFENSDVELLAAQQKSYSGELAFLAAYVAYQEGRAQQAVRLINAAKEAMPDSIAVARLKNIIDPEPAIQQP